MSDGAFRFGGYRHDEASKTPETDAVEQAASNVMTVIRHARKLETQRDRAVALLRLIVALDDGDSPDLWHYESEFNEARAFLAELECK